MGHPIPAYKNLAPVLTLDGTTDNAIAINKALDELGESAVAEIPNLPPNTSVGISHPIIVPKGVTLRGPTAFAGGDIHPTSAFPRTTLNGNQTTPAAGTFTLNVAATAGFPLGVGGATPPNRKGVLCVAGITIFYSGTTGTTFTGCFTSAMDTNVALTSGRVVGTFMVWMGEPAGTDLMFGTRLEEIRLNANDTPGISGVWAAFLQEGAGWDGLLVYRFKNFGIRLDFVPGLEGDSGHHSGNRTWLRFSDTCEPEAVGFDASSGRGPLGAVYGHWGYAGWSIIASHTTQNLGKAGVRFNGVQTRMNDVNIEKCPVGILVGDRYAANVNLEGLSTWGQESTDALVRIGNTPGNVVLARRLLHSLPDSQGKLIDDLRNSYSCSDVSMNEYNLLGDGRYVVNGGLGDSALLGRL